MIDQLRNLVSSAARRLPVVSLLLVFLAVPATLLEPVAQVLQFDRSAFAAGEVWRLLSCHLTHWSFDHLLWDVVALAVLGLLCEPTGRRRFVGCLLASAVAIPLCVGIFETEIQTYRGLSGLDSAVFILLAVTILGEAWERRNWITVTGTLLVLLGFCGKIGFELATGATLFVDSQAAEMIPLPLSHLVGAAVGCLFGLLGRNSTRPTKDRPPTNLRREESSVIPCPSAWPSALKPTSPAARFSSSV